MASQRTGATKPRGLGKGATALGVRLITLSLLCNPALVASPILAQDSVRTPNRRDNIPDIYSVQQVFRILDPTKTLGHAQNCRDWVRVEPRLCKNVPGNRVVCSTDSQPLAGHPSRRWRQRGLSLSVRRRWKSTDFHSTAKRLHKKIQP